jgi:hypothetical protein
MIQRVVFLLLPLAVSACAGGHPPLSEASGPYRPLNAGRWAPTRDDLRGPRAPLAPVDSPYANPAVLNAPAAPATPGGLGA